MSIIYYQKLTLAKKLFPNEDIYYLLEMSSMTTLHISFISTQWARSDVELVKKAHKLKFLSFDLMLFKDSTQLVLISFSSSIGINFRHISARIIFALVQKYNK